ncbi:MAG: HAD-IA family hydrolase [Propionibacteriaceae bacterium]|nr:HAD-IA family hydrolase [Propionibacteriaceae bacterium]
MNSSPRWPVVLFDIDGTLINTIDLIVASYQYALGVVLGEQGDEAEIRTWIGRPLIEAFETLNPEKSQELMDAYMDWNYTHTPLLLKQYDGVLDLLQELHHSRVRLGAVTSKRRDPALWCLDLADMTPLMPLLVSAEDTKLHKPNPEPLLAACRILDIQPQEAVYIGDAVVDIRAAQAAGMDSIGVTWGARTSEALAEVNSTALVTSVDELRALLLSLPPRT